MLATQGKLLMAAGDGAWVAEGLSHLCRWPMLDGSGHDCCLRHCGTAPQRHFYGIEDRHVEPPSGWRFRLVRVHGVEGVEGVEGDGSLIHASQGEITDGQPAPGDPR